MARGGSPGNRQRRSNTGNTRPLRAGGGGTTGYTGGTSHGGGKSPGGCGKKKTIVAMPFLLLAVLFYALPRLAYDTWRGRSPWE